MDREKEMLENAFSKRRNFLNTYLNKAKNFRQFSNPTKDFNVFLQKGNKLYNQKPHDNDVHLKTLENYCKAICVARRDSEEIAIAYATRSAFLLHVRRYEDCMKDINRALKITRLDNLKIKLLCCKVQCTKKLGLTVDESALEEAIQLVEKIDDKKSQKAYNTYINTIKTMPTNVACNRVKKEIFISSEDVSGCVKMDYTKEFGRHLLAAKDYAPGDVIFVEDTYATHINPRLIYTNCDYCLETAWSGVPCVQCNLILFCSEECRDKAWKLYHDIECPLIQFLKNMDELVYLIKFELRVLIIAIREAGNLFNLKQRLIMVDKCTNVRMKGFLVNGIFDNNTIESLYSLSSHYPEEDFQFLDQAVTVLMVMIGLVTQTKLLKNFSLKTIDDLMTNDDVLFLGSLMMKLIMIRRNTIDTFYSPYNTYKIENNVHKKLLTDYCARGVYMASLTSLINHSCFPNAIRSWNNNKKVIIYAIHPIKEDEPIFISYGSHFYDQNIQERKQILRKRNIFKCFCIACKENWPAIITTPENFPDILRNNSRSAGTLQEICEKMVASIVYSDKSSADGYSKEAHVKLLSEAITEAFNHLEQPSYITCSIIRSLNKLLANDNGSIHTNLGGCDYFVKSN